VQRAGFGVDSRSPGSGCHGAAVKKSTLFDASKG
jgi:hypothetical protein